MFDIEGSTCEQNGGIDCDTYIIIKIDGKQVHKSKTIDNNSYPNFKETFVSEFISMGANIEIEMWDSDEGYSANDLMSAWSETAEFYVNHGEQTLLGNKTADQRQNSLRIRAEWIMGEKSESMYFICISFKPSLFSKTAADIFQCTL